MISLYLVSFFFGMIVIAYWAKINDAVPPDGKTKGLLRMTFTNVVKKASPDRGALGRGSKDYSSLTDAR